MASNNPMVPTPKTPVSNPEETMYRGVALQQLAILRQQMKLGGLRQGKRSVSLGDGVTVEVSINFNDERVQVRVANHRSMENLVVSTQFVCAHILPDDYSSGYFSSMHTYKLFQFDCQKVSARQFLGQYGNINWIGRSGVLSWMGPLSRYTAVNSNYTDGLTWWLSLGGGEGGGGEGGSVPCNYTPFIYADGKQLVTAPLDTESAASGLWAGYCLVVGAGMVGGRLVAILYRESGNALVAACYSGGTWRYSSETIAISSINEVSAALFGWTGQVVINRIALASGGNDQRMDGTVTLNSEYVPILGYTISDNTVLNAGENNYHKIKTDFSQDLIASLNLGDYFMTSGLMASYYELDSTQTIATDWSANTRVELTALHRASSIKERRITVSDEVPEYSYGATFTVTQKIITSYIQVVTEIYEELVDGILLWAGNIPVSSLTVDRTSTSDVTYENGVAVYAPWSQTVESYGVVPANCDLGKEGSPLGAEAYLLMQYGRRIDYFSTTTNTWRTTYTLADTGYAMSRRSTYSEEGVSTPPTQLTIHTPGSISVKATLEASVSSVVSMGGVEIPALGRQSSISFDYSVETGPLIGTTAYTPDTMSGALTESNALLLAADLRSGSLVSERQSYQYPYNLYNYIGTAFTALYDVSATTSRQSDIVAQGDLIASQPLPDDMLTMVGAIYSLPSHYISGTSFDSPYIPSTGVGVADDKRRSITSSRDFKGFAAEVDGTQLVCSGSDLATFQSTIFGPEAAQINPISLV